jgi:uncharacterized protein YjlB
MMDEAKDKDKGAILARSVRDLKLVTKALTDDGIFPNNAQLPLLLYSQVLRTDIAGLSTCIREFFAANHWGRSWVNGVFSYHHYHSTAHEVLAVCAGQAELQLGGDKGLRQVVQTGDVVVIPAGVAHKNLKASPDFSVVGAYPGGQTPDLCYGHEDERPRTVNTIAALPLPGCDPVYGTDGPLIECWPKSKLE